MSATKSLVLCCLFSVVLLTEARNGGRKHRKSHPASPTTANINRGNTSSCEFNRVACDRNMKFRSISGLCNNLRHPEYGSAYSLFKRVLPASYTGEGMPKGGDPSSLPSPRLISRNVHKILDIADPEHSHMLMQWGQFLDHDITLTPEIETEHDCSDCSETSEDCFPIDIPNDDSVFPDGSCMRFVRSSNGNPNGQREQVNQITSFIDASNVYGSEVEKSRELRSFQDGKLLVQTDDMLPVNPSQVGCNTTQLTGNQGCFLAGDVRNTEQNCLASIQTLWVREHNKIAEQLASLTSWDDERLYLETRRIVGALMQRITYNEFLPAVVGTSIMQNLGILEESGAEFFTGYDSGCDATIRNEFATAAFRFGHSLVHSDMEVVKQNGATVTNDMHSLDGNFFNPYFLYSDPENINGMLHGACSAAGRRFDANFDEILRDHLFKGTDLGLDLAALNLQRGRDHGLPGYASYRQALGFSSVSSWDDLYPNIMPDLTVVNAMKDVYGSDNLADLDLFTGMLAEMSANSNSDGLLGEVGRKIVADQFLMLKKCDRFFYSSNHEDNKGRFTREQLRAIRKMKLSTILCNHLDENVEFPDYVMERGGQTKPCSQHKTNDYFDLSIFATSDSSRRKCFKSKSVPTRCTPEAESPPEQTDFGVKINGGDQCGSSRKRNAEN